MGNSSANITLRFDHIEAVAGTLESLRRPGYLAKADGALVLFDEAAERAGPEALDALLAELTARHRCAGLAVAYDDDDVLWYALSHAGRIVDHYLASRDSEATADSVRTSVAKARRLCKAFGMPDGIIPAVDALLRRPHTAMVYESRRHAELLQLLKLPAIAVGSRYTDFLSSVTLVDPDSVLLRAVGGAPQPSVAAADASALGLLGPPRHTATGRAYLQGRVRLLFSDVTIPAPLLDLFGGRRMNGLVALERLRDYLHSHDLLDRRADEAFVRIDARLAVLFGNSQLRWSALPGVLAERLGAPPLTDMEIEALNSGDVAFERRYSQALVAAARVLAAGSRWTTS